MRFLALDIGNSFTKYGVFEDDQLTAIFQFETDRFNLATFHEKLLQSLEKNGLLSWQPEALAFCSSVPELAPTLKGFLLSLFPTLQPLNCLHVQIETVPSTINWSNDASQQVGTDRAVILFAAQQIYSNRSLIVGSMGTATTLNGLTAEGVFSGGVITLGFSAFLGAFQATLPHLPVFPYTEVKTNSLQTVGWNTQGCLWLGTEKAYVLMVEALISQLLRTPLLENAALVLTGGMSEKFAAMFKQHTTCNLSFNLVDPTLALQGLRLIYLESVKK